MNKSIRILIVEDSEDDVLFLLRYLKREGFSATYDVVQTAAEMSKLLNDKEFDLVISDYSMPNFDGVSALQLLRKTGLDLPFIIVSGAIGEETAVEAMRAGAHDYVMKNNLTRLGSAIEREIREAAERSELRRAEQAVDKLEQKNELILGSAGEGICGLDEDGRVTFANPSASQYLGWDTSDLVGLCLYDHVQHPKGKGPPHSREDCNILRTIDDGNPRGSEDEVFWRKDGSKFPVEYTVTPFRDKDHKLDGAVVTFKDITERKRSEMELRNALQQVEQLKDKLHAENTYLKEEIKLTHNFDEIIGNSPRFERALQKVEMVAETNATVLVLGETGTGKELIARAIHKLSPRNDHALVKVNCAALPGELIESELFGHEKGAFTSAISRKAGRFELADEGTIFLDEIAELPLDQQAKLLRVLQEGEFERLGGERTIKVDVRVIAATNKDLKTAVDLGEFREDLYYRLQVFPITIPPLRDRKEDIPLLVNHFVRRFCSRFGKEISEIPGVVMDSLKNYGFRGNIRELENIVERAVILTSDKTLRLEEGLISLDQIEASEPMDQTLEEVERAHISNILSETKGIIEGEQGAAVRLGMKPSTLRSKINKLHINRRAGA